ncbi:ribonuclease H2 subunit A isoform X1 [Rhagoletis pomonella]|uniref:ribonuclease H2 subunit A isoform X1 n=1 Tax=Rhagoletis pomonella TaxID=28610 RepID=UPI001783D722|nr:ribonuclease H2 subunit A isoform X1 [Rhagoletis pomonella]
MDSDQDEPVKKMVKKEAYGVDIKSEIAVVKNEEDVGQEVEIKQGKSLTGGLKQEPDESSAEPEVTVNKIYSLKNLGPFIAAHDNSQNTVYFQDLPDICKREPCMLGVDEAGRGPVLGPMVYGIAYCPISSKKVLEDLGCADSKQLTEEKREVIFNEMNTAETPRACVGWAVEIISPNIISTSMLRRTKCSLNEVSMNSAIGLIKRAVAEGVNISEVYVDTVGPPEKYQDKLKGIFPDFKITVAKKADSTYPIVSAASICAKVTRDTALKVWKFPEGIRIPDNKFGSGYPGDPVTKRFLSENLDMFFGFPRLVRFSWSTAENALADKVYELEFDEPEDPKPKYSGPKLTQFFKGATKGGEVQRKPCRFFRERCLDNVTNF